LPQRIVSLAPSATEILFALGAGERVVGVSDYCPSPPAPLALKRVGGALNANFERIVALAPDLLLTVGAATRLGQEAAAAGIPFRSLTMESVADVGRTIGELGRLVGAKERATALAVNLDGQLAAVRQRWATAAPVSTLLVLARPAGRLPGLMTCNQTSFLAELLTLAGGRNCFADAASRYLTPGLEQVVVAAPAVIVELVPDASGWTGNDHRPPLTPRERRQRIAEWQLLATVPAVRDQRVEVITGRDLLVPSLHLAETAAALATAIHRPVPGAGERGAGAVRRAPPRPPPAALDGPPRAPPVR